MNRAVFPPKLTSALGCDVSNNQIRTVAELDSCHLQFHHCLHTKSNNSIRHCKHFSISFLWDIDGNWEKHWLTPVRDTSSKNIPRNLWLLNIHRDLLTFLSPSSSHRLSCETKLGCVRVDNRDVHVRGYEQMSQRINQYLLHLYPLWPSCAAFWKQALSSRAEGFCWVTHFLCFPSLL